MKRIREQLVEKMPSALCLNEVVFDRRGKPIDYKLLGVNPAFERQFGLGKEEVIGKNMSQWLLISNTERDLWFKAFADLVATSGRKEFKEVLKINDHWYLVTAFVPYPRHLVVLFHEAARYQKAHTSLAEIRREFQASLETTQAFSQSIFQNSPSSIVIYEVLKDGKSSWDYIIRGVNPAALQIENWREEEVLGKPLGSLRPGADEFGIIEVFRHVWKTGEVAHYPARIYKEGDQHRWYENVVFKLPTDEVVAVYNDISERMQIQEELFTEKEKLRVTLYSIGDAVITTDVDGRVEILNPVAEELTGWKLTEAAGRSLHSVFDIYNEQTGKPVENPANKVLETGKVVGLANHTVLKAKNGKEYAISDSAAPIFDTAQKMLGIVLVFRDETEARQRQARIEYLSFRDALTGLYNRAFAEEEYKRMDSEAHYPLSVIIGDLDGLKLINDAFGHHVGNQILVKMADILRKSTRETDFISRWGGDEFLLLLPKTKNAEAMAICKEIQKSVKADRIADIELRISLGCATKSKREEKRQDILSEAENNMYKAKLLEAKSYRNVVLTSIINTLYEKSHETEEHAKRLAHYCRAIGEILELPPLQLDELEVFCMLHDIGKIGIDERILQKPGKLNEAEWEVIKTHPEIGYRIASTVPELTNIANYILTHHERWDGTGYPKGLAGEEIPLLARILAVVDAFDAMTQDRVYRKALSLDEAKEELRQNSGTQFDPEIVEIFLNYLEEKKEYLG